MLAMAALTGFRRAILLSRSAIVAVPIIVSVLEQYTMKTKSSLLDYSLDAIKTHLQNVHSWTVTQSNVLVARRIEQVSSLAGVEIEEDARYDNDLFMETGVEEVETIVDAFGERRQVQPQVEGGVRDKRDLEAHFSQSTNNIVSLFAEVVLQGTHFVLDFSGLKHRDSSLLEGDVGASIEVRSTRADSLDELLGSNDPGDSPTGKTEALCQTVNDQDIWFALDRSAFTTSRGHTIFIDVFDVVSSRDNSTIAIASVIVAAVEFIHDQCRTISACRTRLGSSCVSIRFQNLQMSWI